MRPAESTTRATLTPTAPHAPAETPPLDWSGNDGAASALARAVEAGMVGSRTLVRLLVNSAAILSSRPPARTISADEEIYVRLRLGSQG